MRDIGIDLGTTNVLIYVKGKGIVLNEPSVVCVDKDTKKVLAVGKDAKDMLGKTPEKVEALKPLQDGVIADIDVTEKMIKKFIRKATGRKILAKPKIIICCPSNITAVEKSSIQEIAYRMGGKGIYIEEEPKVAAIGAGIDITKPSGSMIIDIGGGTTDIAVLSLGGIVTCNSIKLAGSTFDQDIIEYIREKYKVIIGELTAEELKVEIGTVLTEKKDKMEVTGRSIEEGIPETITVNSKDIEQALKQDIKKIVEATKTVLEKTPPELCADIKEKGIILTGGGSLIDGLVDKLRHDLKIPVFISDNPLTDVVEGTGILLNNLNLIDN